MEVRPVGNGRKERTLGKSSDAESRQIRCGACRGISPLADRLLPIAVGMTRKEQNQETALIPNVGVVFTVGGPLVYEEGGQSVSMSRELWPRSLSIGITRQNKRQN